MHGRRVGWTTDIHLNFVNLPQWDAFLAELADSRIEALWLTGDISEADDVAWQLQRVASHADCPVYFVLGNHDFYRGSIDRVRRQVTEAAAKHPGLHYLTGAPPVALGGDWVLCGEDGWADARVGDFFKSPIRMNDFRLIEELQPLASEPLYRFLRRQGAASARRMSIQLNAAAQLGRRIAVLTHIPPFREACWYEHQHSNDDWAPFFVCHGVGWALRRFCRAHPLHEVLVLCGHTHHPGRSRIAPNLTVWTGRAEYCEPRMERVIDLDGLQYPDNDWDFENPSEIRGGQRRAKEHG